MEINNAVPGAREFLPRSKLYPLPENNASSESAPVREKTLQSMNEADVIQSCISAGKETRGNNVALQNLSAISTGEVSRILLGSEKDKQESTPVNALWSHSKQRTAASDVVYDKVNKVIYTGIEPVDKSNENSWKIGAFNPDGTKKWTFEGSYVGSTPLIDRDGNVCVRSRDALFIIDKDGSYKAGIATHPSPWADVPPVIGKEGEILLIEGHPEKGGAYDSHLRLSALRDGKRIWSYDAVANTLTDPQVLVGTDGTIFLPAVIEEKAKTLRGRLGWDLVEIPALISLNPDGTEKLRIKVDGWGTIQRELLAEGPDGTIYACTGKNRLEAFTSKGKRKWLYKAGANSNAPGDSIMITRIPCFGDGGKLYVTINTKPYPEESDLVCLDREGHELWKRHIDSEIRTKPMRGPDGFIYVGTISGQLLAFDEMGKMVSQTTPGEMSNNNFAFGEKGEILINTCDKFLALRPPDPSNFGKDPEEDGSLDKRVNVEEEFIVIDGLKLPKTQR